MSDEHADDLLRGATTRTCPTRRWAQGQSVSSGGGWNSRVWQQYYLSHHHHHHHHPPHKFSNLAMSFLLFDMKRKLLVPLISSKSLLPLNRAADRDGASPQASSSHQARTPSVVRTPSVARKKRRRISMLLECAPPVPKMTEVVPFIVHGISFFAKRKQKF